MTAGALEQKFESAMFDIYRRAKSEDRYNATTFLRMLNDHGGLAAAKTLINARNQLDGFTALHLAGRLDLTVEALVVENSLWHPLFTGEEIVKARNRLARNHYAPKECE